MTWSRSGARNQDKSENAAMRRHFLQHRIVVWPEAVTRGTNPCSAWFMHAAIHLRSTKPLLLFYDLGRKVFSGI